MTFTRPAAMVLGLLGLALAALPAIGSGALPHPPSSGQRVDVGDHSMYINCTGAGGPTVVLEAGLGGTSLDWARVQPKVAQHNRVCSYDRSGYGWSDAGPLPRTSLTIVQELHALLAKVQAREPPPYVLVGHSFGGFNVRLFANRYPGLTAGLVLVDASHEDQFRRLENHGAESIAPRGQFVLFSQPRLPATFPPSLRPVARALASQPSTWRAIRGELAAFRYSAAEVVQHEWLPGVPLVVVTRGKRVWPHNPEGDRKEAIWKQLQDNLVHHEPGAVHLVARNSGHYIPLEQPRTVVRAICIAVQTARAGNPDHPLPRVWLKQQCRR